MGKVYTLYHINGNGSYYEHSPKPGSGNWHSSHEKATQFPTLTAAIAACPNLNSSLSAIVPIVDGEPAKCIRFNEIKLTRILSHAADWSSDKKDKGLALLVFTSCRKIRSEEHREECFKEIDDNIKYCEQLKSDATFKDFDPRQEIMKFQEMRACIRDAQIGIQLMPYDDYAAIQETLFSEGSL
jgi:hypothetical protein